jgi:hypothetical protein
MLQYLRALRVSDLQYKDTVSKVIGSDTRRIYAVYRVDIGTADHSSFKVEQLNSVITL